MGTYPPCWVFIVVLNTKPMIHVQVTSQARNHAAPICCCNIAKEVQAFYSGEKIYKYSYS